MVEAKSADGKVKVVLEDIGEGKDGDYDPSDPDDKPLLRFTVYRRGEREWEELDDSSYCTQIPVTTEKDEQLRLARLILAEVEAPAREHGRVKKLCERLSWVNPTWGTPAEKQGYVL